jgi:hypothetical protein
MADSLLPLLLPLATAHLAGDFLFSRSRNEVIAASPVATRTVELLLYSVRHGALAYLLCGVLEAWSLAVVVFVTHGIIAGACVGSLSLIDPSGEARYYRRRILFFSEQVLHAAALVATAGLFASRLDLTSSIVLGGPSRITEAVMILAAGAIFTLPAGARVIEVLTAEMLDQLAEERARGGEPGDGSAPRLGLEGGGRWIGLCERALIFVVVLARMELAVGFLIAAKSILRFGDVKNRHDRMEAEYIIIGTLLSFLWGIAGAWITRQLLFALPLG